MTTKYEEGDPCPQAQGICDQACTGHLEYGPVDGCTCHISPPCNACMTNPLQCNTCNWTTEENDQAAP